MSETILSESKGAVVLALHVQPGARRAGVVGPHGDALKIVVRAAATEGKANVAVRALVAEAFDLAPSDVEIISGPTNRRKRVRLSGLDLAQAAARLDRILDVGRPR